MLQATVVSCSLSSSKISQCVLFLSLFYIFFLTMHASANRLSRVPKPGPNPGHVPAPEPKPCPSPGPNPGPVTPRKHNKTFPAIFAFGDSILDTGNNDYILTLIKANFLPYGMNFPDGVPTGRFCNGKIPSDFIGDFPLLYHIMRLKIETIYTYKIYMLLYLVST